MTFERWLLFVVAETVLCVTPGPAVLFVLSCGLAQGGRAALWANAGILSGNGVYFTLSALGLGAVLVASHEFFTVIKYVGAAYLIFLGALTFRGGGIGLDINSLGQSITDGWRMFGRGFLLQTANAKSLLFFVAFLPQFVDPQRSMVTQVVALAVTSVAIEFVVLGGYGYFAGRAAQLARQARFATATNRVSGGMLVVAGTAVALTRDS